MRYIVTEINMEKKSPSIIMLTVIVVVTVLVIPMLPGITAENNNSISKELQWCCSYIETEKNNFHTLSIPSIDIKSNFNI
jgi:competence protein ComGC